MLKVIKVVLIIILVLFSFYYTDKSVDIIRNADPIMTKIKSTNSKYNKDAINAKIIDNKIIPGQNGKIIDYHKSYTKMKQYGAYNEVLTTLKEIEPEISIDDYYDKYIIKGNDTKKSVALVFKVTEMTNLKEIIDILNSKNIKSTLFIDGLLLENNTNYISTLTNHEIEILSYDNKYDEIYFDSVLNYLSSLTKTSPKFCYAEYDNKEIIELCQKLNLHTIIPTIKITDFPYKTLKEKLTNSSIISLPLTKKLISELPMIIDYILQKGYTIETLDSLLSEHIAK